MHDPHAQQIPRSVGRRCVVGAAVAAVVIAAVVSIHGPAVELALTGDSYQWIQHAHAAMERPLLLLADLDTFYRPANTWSLALDRLVWGGFNASGFRTTSLALHALVALALAVAARRFGLGPLSAGAIALLWVASPFTDESAFVVAYRFQPLLLLAWLALIVLWPRPDEDWSRGRMIAVALAVAGAAAAKETWVVTPALVAALELDRGAGLRRAVRSAALVGIAVGGYVAAYFLAFPTGKTYYELGVHIPAKLPSQLAAFLYLDEPLPFALSLTWVGVLALAVAVALAVTALRWRVRGAWTALALLVAPTLPTLAVPYMPQRYLAIPYAGFLLLVGLWVADVDVRFSRWRLAIRVVAITAVGLFVAAGAALVRADLDDYRDMAAAHERLLDEASAVKDVVAVATPVLVIRGEEYLPLLDVVRDPTGLPKLAFIRHIDPYGLIDAAALFEWVLADDGTRVEHVENWTEVCAGVDGQVLEHVDGSFVVRGPVPDVAAEARRAAEAGRRLRVIRTVRGE
jgi:hypothetical protein